MRFYQGTHDFYAGIDLHTKTMYVCVLDQGGRTVVHRNIPARPGPLLEVRAPCRSDVVIAAECTFSSYWLADLCAAEAIPFVLGLGMNERLAVRAPPWEHPNLCHRPQTDRSNTRVASQQRASRRRFRPGVRESLLAWRKRSSGSSLCGRWA